MVLLASAASIAVVTLMTMLVAVALSYYSIQKIRFPGMSRYEHALAGATISTCGASILFLGL